MFVLLQRLFTHVRLGILETSLGVYDSVVVQGMYTCKTGNFGNGPLCLCQCCCRGYVNMQEWGFCKRDFVFMLVLLFKVCTHVRMGNLKHDFVFMLVLLYRVCTHVRLGILVTSLFVYVCVVVQGMYICKTGHFGNMHCVYNSVVLQGMDTFQTGNVCNKNLCL